MNNIKKMTIQFLFFYLSASETFCQKVYTFLDSTDQVKYKIRILSNSIPTARPAQPGKDQAKNTVYRIHDRDLIEIESYYDIEKSSTCKYYRKSTAPIWIDDPIKKASIFLAFPGSYERNTVFRFSDVCCNEIKKKILLQQPGRQQLKMKQVDTFFISFKMGPDSDSCPGKETRVYIQFELKNPIDYCY